jgi:hypothetical protein
MSEAEAQRNKVAVDNNKRKYFIKLV